MIDKEFLGFSQILFVELLLKSWHIHYKQIFKCKKDRLLNCYGKFNLEITFLISKMILKLVTNVFSYQKCNLIHKMQMILQFLCWINIRIYVSINDASLHVIDFNKYSAAHRTVKHVQCSAFKAAMAVILW